MGQVKHGDLTVADGIGTSIRWEVADAAALAALVPVAAERGSIALQLDTLYYWILVNATGPIWHRIDLPVASANDTFLQRAAGVLTWAGLTIGMVANNLITRAKLAQAAALTVVGNATNATANVTDIAAGADDRLLARVSSTLSFVQLTLGMIPDALITAAKLTGVLEMAYTSTVTSSRNIALTDAFKTMPVDSTSGAVVITLVQDSTVNIPVGQHGCIRWMASANQVSVAQGAGATVNSSGGELKLGRLYAPLYWEKTAANTYFVSGEKSA